MYHLAPSILAADFLNLGEEIKKVERAGATYLHLDIMDGAFVPSISYGRPIVQAVRPATSMILDVHMMVEEPGRYIEDMVLAGADLICIHPESCTHLDRTIQQIKSFDKKVGVAINPATSLSVLDYVIDQVDMILIMLVNPGFGGQTFIPYTLEKVRTLRKRLLELGLSTDIQVDGGVTLTNVHSLIEAGATIIVAGTSVFQGNIVNNVKDFLKIFQEIEE